MRGVTLYVGAPGWGKTHAALEDLEEWQGDRWIVDLGDSRLLSGIPRAVSPRAQSPGTWRFTPEDPSELAQVYAVAHARGNIALLVDDVAAMSGEPGYAAAHKRLAKCCRTWRSRNLRILLTTQHVSGDVGQVILACDPRVVAFQTTSPASLDWLYEQFQVERSELAELGLGEALELSF